MIRGTIQKGSGQATKVFSLPTANLSLDVLDAQVEPGVYAVRAYVDGAQYQGLTFLGQAHLLPGKPWRLETHFFDQSGDFVGKELKLELLKLLRAPQTFTSPSQAAMIVQQDVAAARAFFD